VPPLGASRTDTSGSYRSLFIGPVVGRTYDPLMPTLFTRIIDGEIPAKFVWKDEWCVGFLSINPLAPGHTLVVPRAEVDHWIDLPEDLASHLWRVAQTVGQAQQVAFVCERIGLIVAGYEVPHAHIHVFPSTNMAQFNFARAAVSVSEEELDAAAGRIRAALGAGGG
jgi:histidine triad (HIT) family protein